MTDPSHEVHTEKLRLAILTAIDAALHRHAEVSAVIAAAADRSGAEQGLTRLLGIHTVPAGIVLSLTWERLTADGRRRIADEIAELAAAVGVDVVPHEAWTEPGMFGFAS